MLKFQRLLSLLIGLLLLAACQIPREEGGPKDLAPSTIAAATVVEPTATEVVEEQPIEKVESPTSVPGDTIVSPVETPVKIVIGPTEGPPEPPTVEPPVVKATQGPLAEPFADLAGKLWFTQEGESIFTYNFKVDALIDTGLDGVEPAPDPYGRGYLVYRSISPGSRGLWICQSLADCRRLSLGFEDSHPSWTSPTEVSWEADTNTGLVNRHANLTNWFTDWVSQQPGGEDFPASQTIKAVKFYHRSESLWAGSGMFASTHGLVVNDDLAFSIGKIVSLDLHDDQIVFAQDDKRLWLWSQADVGFFLEVVGSDLVAQPTFSPDGRYVAYQRFLDGSWKICLFDTATWQTRVLIEIEPETGPVSEPDQSGRGPTWGQMGWSN